MLNFIVFLLIVSFALILIGILIEWNKWKINKQINGYNALFDFPIIGSAVIFLGKNEKESTQIIDKLLLDPHQPKVPLRFWIGLKLFVVISHPDDLRTVLNATSCLNKPFQFKTLQCENSLGLSKSIVWKHDRRLLNPTFNNAVLMGFLPELNAMSIKLCNEMRKSLNVDHEFKNLLMTCLVNQVIRTAFDIDYAASVNEAVGVFRRVTQIEHLAKRRLNRFWLQWDFIYRLTDAYQQEAVIIKEYRFFLKRITNFKITKLNERLASGEDILTNRKNDNTLTFVQKLLLLKRDGVVDEKYVDDHLFLLFLTNITTTMTTIMSTLLLLAIYPDYQAKVVQELKSVLGSMDSPISADALSKMTFIEMVIKESLRLFPPVPVLLRKSTDDIHVGDATIPKNTTIMISLPKLHHDQRQWGENANDFYPERFSAENIDKIHPYSFLSFSNGPRNCIGGKQAMMTLKVSLGHILRHFKFTTHLKLSDIRLNYNISAYVANERPFRIERRTY